MRQSFTQLEEHDPTQPDGQQQFKSNELAQTVANSLQHEGFALIEASAMQYNLGKDGGLSDWHVFAKSWSGMPIDKYIADGGSYRRRRYSVFGTSPTAGEFVLQPARPHFQPIKYNISTGGIERWYEPFSTEIAKSASLTTILKAGRTVFERLSSNRSWHIEAHQFRVEARADEVAKPTPEGIHRDGVDFGLVMMIDRTNVLNGETTIYSNGDGDPIGKFTLLQPLECLLIVDNKVRHNVSPIIAKDPGQLATRDVLVVTFSTTQR